MSRLRVGTAKLLNAILLPVGVIAAVVLVLIGQVGGFDMAVFVALATVLTVAAFVSLEFGIMALIVAASLDGFLKGLSPGWHTQLLKDYILGICMLRWAWLSVLGHRRRSAQHPLAIPIILFAVWCGVQFLNSRNPNTIMTIADLRSWIIWLPTFFLAYDCIRTRRQVERFVIFIFVVMTPLAIYGIVQYQIGLDHLYRLGPGFNVYLKSQYATPAYEIELRPPSTMISPHSLAAACVMLICLGIGAAAYFHGRRAVQALVAGAMPFLGIALLMTAVRNAYGSAAAAIVVLLALIRRPDLVILVAIIGGVAFLQVNQLTGGKALDRLNTIVTQPEYTHRRIIQPWRTALHWAGKYPLGGGLSSGVGRGRLLWGVGGRSTLDPEHRTPWAENEYARALIELGIPGFLLFVWMLISVTRHVFRAYRVVEDRRDRWLIAGIFAAVTSMLLRLLVGSALYGWPEAIIFWCYVAIALRLPEIEAEERRQVATPLTTAKVRPVDSAR